MHTPANFLSLYSRNFAFVVFLLNALNSSSAADRTSFKFDFGPGKVASGYTQVLPTMIYSKETGFGFETNASIVGVDRGRRNAVQSGFCTSDRPFYFSVAVPEGNYKVTVTLGDAQGASTNTIKAELRRLMLEKIVTPRGKFITRTFTVNVRTPQIPGDGQVKLKDREKDSEVRAWDEKLTLEFNGARPCICALTIERADDLPTVYILGDSTVCDQPLEPFNSWGQMLPRFLKPDVVVANHAESGETLKNTLGAKRLDKVLSTLRKGDYLFIQFGHNDMKDRATNALATYKSNLKRFVKAARDKGATPVLVTSMERKAGVEAPTLKEYPETMREVAREENVTLIDLNRMSLVFYHALGPSLEKAFAPGDPTHHNNYGSYQFAQCVIQGIQQSKLKLAKSIVKDFKGYDPAHPDPLETFEMAASPGPVGAKPLGD
jgi:lysophospholipase L1-like esterase